MTPLEWILASSLLMIYITCLFTVCGLTFQKGHIVLGIAGIFFPILWLVGAILPAKEGSRHSVREANQRQYQIEQMTR